MHLVLGGISALYASCIGIVRCGNMAIFSKSAESFPISFVTSSNFAILVSTSPPTLRASYLVLLRSNPPTISKLSGLKKASWESFRRTAYSGAESREARRWSYDCIDRRKGGFGGRGVFFVRRRPTVAGSPDRFVISSSARNVGISHECPMPKEILFQFRAHHDPRE